jgi:hypothetical protein
LVKFYSDREFPNGVKPKAPLVRQKRKKMVDN